MIAEEIPEVNAYSMIRYLFEPDAGKSGLDMMFLMIDLGGQWDRFNKSLKQVEEAGQVPGITADTDTIISITTYIREASAAYRKKRRLERDLIDSLTPEKMLEWTKDMSPCDLPILIMMFRRHDRLEDLSAVLNKARKLLHKETEKDGWTQRLKRTATVLEALQRSTDRIIEDDNNDIRNSHLIKALGY